MENFDYVSFFIGHCLGATATVAWFYCNNLVRSKKEWLDATKES